MPNLAEIEHEISNVLAVAEELDEDQHPTAVEYLEELGIQEQEKVDAISYAVRRRKHDIEFLKTEEERIRARRKSMERRLQEFREYLCWLMERHGLTKLKGRKGSLSLREVTAVEVTDLSNLPSDLVETKIEFKPRKKDIKAKLQAGQEVTGAKLSTSTSLTIR